MLHIHPAYSCDTQGQIKPMALHRANNQMDPSCVHAMASQICLREISATGRVSRLEPGVKTTQGLAAGALTLLPVTEDLAKPVFKSLCPSHKPPEAPKAPHSPVHLRRLPLDFGARLHHLFGNLTAAKDKSTGLCTDAQGGRGETCTCIVLNLTSV